MIKTAARGGTFVSKLDPSFLTPFIDAVAPFGPCGYVTAMRTYARKLDEECECPKEGCRASVHRIEAWWQVVARCVNALGAAGAWTRQELEELFYFWFNLKALGGGRHNWQLGTKAVERFGADSLNNCWFVAVDNLHAMEFGFDQLMLGGGVGFSVRAEHIYKLPKVKHAPDVREVETFDCDLIVTDNREGWVELLHQVFNSFFHEGKKLHYNVKCLREKGKRIKTFGGTASGGQVLVDGIQRIVAILRGALGRNLTDVECIDICTLIGSIVVAGNVRRSAIIMIGDHNSQRFLDAKNWTKGPVPSWRQRSNNTVACPAIAELPDRFWENYNGEGEPVGLFNINVARNYGRLIDGRGYRSDPKVEGLNPCQPGHATVLTPEGIRTFDDITVGSTIWARAGWTKVVKKVATGIKPVFEYHTRAGTFIGTAEHRVVDSGVKVEAQHAETIDRCSGGIPDFEDVSPWDVMAGLLIGDGTVHKSSNDKVLLCIGENDHDYFSSEVSGLIGEHRPGIKSGTYEVASRVEASELPKTYERRIPTRYFQGSGNEMRGFLRGLYSANGSVVRGRVTLKAASFQVISQVQQMLSALGIGSYYTTNAAHEVEFSNGVYECRESYDLNINTDRDEFFTQIGFLQEYKNKALEKQLSTEGRSKVSYEIVGVKPLGEMEVFDITVDDPEHVYWTGGLLVSNCGEITLEPWEACNLADIVLPNLANVHEFFTAAKLMVKVCKTVSCIRHKEPETREVVERNHRLGVGITGFLQAMHFHDEKLFDQVYKEMEATDRNYSKLMGVGPSNKLSTFKPSGTLSTLAGCTPGAHPGFGEYYIRRIEFSSDDVLVDLLRKHGHWVEPKLNMDGTRDERSMIVEFPCQTPAGAMLEEDMSAVQQMDTQLWAQTHWADNSVSFTVKYDKEELPAMRKWLSENYDEKVKSISFLLRGDASGFKQMPYETITKAEYEDMRKGITPLTSGAETFGSIQGIECGENGACPIR